MEFPTGIGSGTDVLVDANVLIDVAIGDPRWSSWSLEALAAARRGRLILSPIVYANVAATFARMEDLDAFLFPTRFHREDLPWEAAFLAGKAFLDYRRRSGTETAPLPDFLIGAHAAVRDHALLARDRGRFATYFPTVPLIAPSR